MDTAVASHDGKVYVVGGYDGNYPVQDANVYAPAANSWSPIAPLPERLQAASAGFIGNTLYVAGAGTSSATRAPTLYAYDPGTNTWSTVASLPAGVAAAGSAVAGGKLDVIGGCTGACGATTTAAYSYDPGNDSWSQLPDYPVGWPSPPVAGWTPTWCARACGGTVAWMSAGTTGFTLTQVRP